MITNQLLSLAQAAKLFPTHPSPQTLWRWRTRGVNGVTLACVKCGKSWYTTAAAIETFLAAQTLAASPQLGQGQPARQRDEVTLERLRRAGLLGCGSASPVERE